MEDLTGQAFGMDAGHDRFGAADVAAHDGDVLVGRTDVLAPARVVSESIDDDSKWTVIRWNFSFGIARRFGHVTLALNPGNVSM